MDVTESGSSETLARARSAAVAFARMRGYSTEQIDQIGAEPVLGPVTFDRDGATVTAFRWIGAGRGSTYVQVELIAGTPVLVRGARGDTELGEWISPQER